MFLKDLEYLCKIKFLYIYVNLIEFVLLFCNEKVILNGV